MLVFDNPFNVPVQKDEVEKAALLLCQAQLIQVAGETNLQLLHDSFQVFSQYVERAIRDPNTRFTVSELVVSAQLFALRGARDMIAMREARFHEGAWPALCPFWPFC